MLNVRFGCTFVRCVVMAIRLVISILWIGSLCCRNCVQRAALSCTSGVFWGVLHLLLGTLLENKSRRTQRVYFSKFCQIVGDLQCGFVVNFACWGGFGGCVMMIWLISFVLFVSIPAIYVFIPATLAHRGRLRRSDLLGRSGKQP